MSVNDVKAAALCRLTSCFGLSQTCFLICSLTSWCHQKTTRGQGSTWVVTSIPIGPFSLIVSSEHTALTPHRCVLHLHLRTGSSRVRSETGFTLKLFWSINVFKSKVISKVKWLYFSFELHKTSSSQKMMFFEHSEPTNAGGRKGCRWGESAAAEVKPAQFWNVEFLSFRQQLEAAAGTWTRLLRSPAACGLTSSCWK